MTGEKSTHQASVDGREPPPKQVAAAMSKLISASIGEIAVVFARAEATKHHQLADIEWLIMPAVLSGQFYVVEATDKQSGVSAPVAAVTWARVSAEVDRRLTENVGQPIRLYPDEWTGGDIYWLIHLVGNPHALEAGLRQCASGKLNGCAAKIVTRRSDGHPQVQTLHDLILGGASSGLVQS